MEQLETLTTELEVKKRQLATVSRNRKDIAELEERLQTSVVNLTKRIEKARAGEVEITFDEAAF